MHQITWDQHNISVSIVGFGDCARMCRMDTPTSCQKQICSSSTKVSWHYKYSAYPSSLFKFFALFAALLLMILTPGTNAILMAYQINTH